MVKSFTKNVKKKMPIIAPKNVEAIAELAQQYVQHWTRTEAQKLVKHELLILPTKWGMQVGKHAVKNVGKTWHVYNPFDELIDAFTSKQSAVTYCILEQTNRINMAAELRSQDTKLSKLLQDQNNYATRRVKAVKAVDTVRTDIIDARLSETASLLELAKENLEKTLIKAKYLKGIWE